MENIQDNAWHNVLREESFYLFLVYRIYKNNLQGYHEKSLVACLVNLLTFIEHLLDIMCLVLC